MKNKHRFHGIIPPLVTPLNRDESLDNEALHRLIQHCVEGGSTGVFVNGTSGEAMRVTDSVWEHATKTALDAAPNRTNVFCGAIDSSTSRCIEKIKKIEQMGGKLAVCTPPFYIKNFGQDEILRHYDRICGETSLEIAVYNIPNTTHVNILPETIAKLATYEKIVVYKESSANWQQLQEVLIMLEDADISVFNGAEELCAVSMLFGAQGCIPGLANFVPALFVDLCAASREGDVEKVYTLQKKVNVMRKCLAVGPAWITVMKYLLEVYGLGQSYVSAPLPEINDQQKALVKQILECESVLSRRANDNR